MDTIYVKKQKVESINLENKVEALENKLGLIGYTYSTGFNSLTLSNGAYEHAATLRGLPKGTYIVMTIYNFNASANGVRRTITYANSDTVPTFTRYNGATMQPLSNGVSILQYTRVLTLNEETNTIGLAGYQSSGSSMTGCSGMIYATRIA